MATTIDTDLAGKIMSASAMEAFTKKLCPLQAFTTSFDTEAGQVGEKIVIPFVPEFANNASGGTSTVQTFNRGTNDYDKDLGAFVNDVQVSLGTHKYTNWQLTDQQVADNAIAQLETFGNQKGADLANAIFTDVTSAFKRADFATFETVTSTLTIEDIINARKAMVANGGDPTQCALLLNSDYYAKALSLAEFTADAYGGSEAIRQGNLPSIVGIPEVYECPTLPNNGEGLVGLLVHKSALAVAFRYLAPNSGGASSYTRVDRLSNEFGMTMGYRQFYKVETGVSFAVLEALYGYSPINGDAAIRITTATS